MQQRKVGNGVDGSISTGAAVTAQVRHGIGTRRAVDSLLGRRETASHGTRPDPHFAAGLVAVLRRVVIVAVARSGHGDEVVTVRRRRRKGRRDDGVDFLLEHRRGASATEMHRFRFRLGARPGREGGVSTVVGFARTEFDGVYGYCC